MSLSSFFDKTTTFQEIAGLDRRISKAVAKLGFVYPTSIQSQCIPLAIEGRDVLGKARTGSGKTIAFGIPIIQNILTALELEQEQGQIKKAIRAIILVPTRELVTQLQKQMESLLYYCSDVVSLLALSANTPRAVQAVQLQELPEIVVSTPTRLLEHLNNNTISLEKSLGMLVIDEADLILSYGYEDDVKGLIAYLPKIHQSILMSATLSPELDALKSIVLHNPETIIMEDHASQSGGEGKAGTLRQFYVECSDKDKFLLLYTLLNLKLIRGKTLLFVNSVDASYRLRLFLEQFSFKSAVLNAELPFNSRLHIIDQYNRGLISTLIATDDSFHYKHKEESTSSKQSDGDNDSSDGDNDDDDDDNDDEDDSSNDTDSDDDSDDDSNNNDEKNKSKENADKIDDDDDDGDEDEDEMEIDGGDIKMSNVFVKTSTDLKNADDAKALSKSEKSKIEEFGVARGIDFQDVKTVVNVEFPTSLESYIHRIGRTARGGKMGTALSIVGVSDIPQQTLLNEILEYQIQLKEKIHAEEEVELVDGVVQTKEYQPDLKKLQFNKADIEPFRYRVEDVSRAVTRAAIKEARLKELRRELLTSKKLKAHFEDNPREYELLKHDKAIRPTKVQKHLANVPSYLVPASLAGVFNGTVDSGSNSKIGRKRKRRGKKRKAVNPLNSFEFSGKISNHGGRGRTAGAAVIAGKTTASGTFSQTKASFNTSTSGRRKWKQDRGKSLKKFKKRKGRRRGR